MNQHSRLLWRCRRGMREMDVLFGKFIENYYQDLSNEEKELFDLFLDEPDVDIYAWIMGRAVPETPGYVNFISKFKKCL
ncbi:MAG: succinate dehydrogenase assembly factor 2 [Gammaproteobacteria bacterium]|nr:succinate dehydrogenase assembly factor 2 [Gammaproteobacteria bacterium]